MAAIHPQHVSKQPVVHVGQGVLRPMGYQTAHVRGYRRFGHSGFGFFAHSWHQLEIYFSESVLKDYQGIELPVIPVHRLVEYKRILGREVKDCAFGLIAEGAKGFSPL